MLLCPTCRKLIYRTDACKGVGVECGRTDGGSKKSTAARKDVPVIIGQAHTRGGGLERTSAEPGTKGDVTLSAVKPALAKQAKHRGTKSKSQTVGAGVEPRPSILTLDILSEMFVYDPETGIMTWKTDTGTCKAGDRAGFKRPSGYRMIQIDGRRYQEHRVAWVLAHGELPAGGLQIDHANQVKDDNRLSNLRAATRAQQQINSPTQANNKHGRGVGWRSDRGVWRADIYVDNERVFLGNFERQEDAQAAYDDAAREYYGEFAPDQAPPVDKKPARKDDRHRPGYMAEYLRKRRAAAREAKK